MHLPIRALAPVLLLMACSKGTEPPRKAADAAPATPVHAVPPDAAEAAPPAMADAATAIVTDAGAASATTGTITGTITFSGAPPVMPLVDRSRDPNCPQNEQHAPWVVVSGSGAVRDALVRLPVGAAPPGKPTRTAVIDQKACTYRPYVIGIVTGQKLIIKNSDPTNHNVRAMNGDDQLFNEMHLQNAGDKVMPIAATPGNAVQLKCDIHPWMESWVAVTDHPFFQVTGADGKFTLANVPPGSYELEVWHPHLGAKKIKVSVEAGKSVEAKLPAYGPGDYRPPEQ
jgi:plastocyanin